MSLALLFALVLWPLHPAREVTVHRYGVVGWVLETRKDSFSGRVVCRLNRGRLSYERQALVFHLPPRLNTYDAAYRIDGGPLLLSRDDAADLATQGFALSDDDLANPSGGLVRIPTRRLGGAKLVQIQPRPNSRPLRFSLNGLAATLAAARQLGCDAIGTNER
jgi:hypothetical protein